MDKIERDVYVLCDRSDFDRISYVQGTNAIPIILHIRDYAIPSGSIAKVYIKRPDNTIEYDVASINGNDVKVDVKTTMFSVAGESILQIRIEKSGKILVTFGMTVCVARNYIDEGTKSENKTDIFTEAIEAANSAAENANNAIEEFKEKANNGEFTGTIRISTVKTGVAGTSAQIKNVGTPRDAVLEVTIPRGDTGAQGLKGDTGAQGPKGDTGAQGPKGDTGAQGPKGDTGEQGPKGDTGAQGPKGDTGPQGPPGSASNVGNGTVTIKQAGKVIGSFTMNQSNNITIELTDNNTQTITGVKGNAESEYRTGNVNITPENIGAVATSKIVKSTNITQEGFLMDGKTASEKFAELNSNIKTDTIDLGAYNIAVGGSQNVNVPYTPPMGYTLIGFSVNYPARYVGGIRYKNNAFEGNLYNISNGAGNYGTTAMVLLMKT